MVGNAQAQRAAAGAFPRDHRDHRNGQPAHLHQIAGNGLALAALLGILAGIGAGGVNEGDEVTLDNRPVVPKKEHVVLLFNKPIGITCTTETHVKGNIISYINYPERIFPIGRLDKDSHGLILLTNDGDLVNQCLRVENGHEKEYVVRVDRVITDEFISKMSKGVRIFNPVNESWVTTLPCKIRKVNDHVFNIILMQGYNRQIRRMCQVFDYKVVDLKRIRFMHLRLDVKQGQYRLLDEKDIAKLKGK